MYSRLFATSLHKQVDQKSLLGGRLAQSVALLPTYFRNTRHHSPPSFFCDHSSKVYFGARMTGARSHPEKVLCGGDSEKIFRLRHNFVFVLLLHHPRSRKISACVRVRV